MSELKSFFRLIWLMPLAFAFHIAEEYWGGFPAWVTGVVGGSMDVHKFIISNTLFMSVLLVATAWAYFAQTRLSVAVLVAWASANLFWDFVYHVLTVPEFNRYSPGLITATFLYFPLSWTVGRACLRTHLLSRVAFGGATAIGAVLMGIVIWGGLYRFVI